MQRNILSAVDSLNTVDDFLGSLVDRLGRENFLRNRGAVLDEVTALNFFTINNKKQALVVNDCDRKFWVELLEGLRSGSRECVALRDFLCLCKCLVALRNYTNLELLST